MKIENVSLNPGLVITDQSVDEASTVSGIIVNENTDDFLVHAKVVNSASEMYPVGTGVIYHILDTESFRDGANAYSLVHESKVKGIYGGGESKDEGEEKA